MCAERIHPVPEAWKGRAWCDNETYLEMYRRSLEDNEGFWAEQARRIDWMRPFAAVKDVSYDAADLHIRWFHDGTLNVAANCIDRHLERRGDQIAIVWEPDDPAADNRFITYQELHREVCRFANVLKAQGVKKGDRVTIYLSMIPELAFAMLACARIGAVHSIVFGGFSPDSLAGRIQDARCEVVVTSDEGLRGGRPIPLKANTDGASPSAPTCAR